MTSYKNDQVASCIPEALCDMLAIRIDTLPWPHPFVNLRAVLNYCEGRTHYQKLRDGAWLRWASDVTLGTTEDSLSRLKLTPGEFQCQYAPEITFSQRISSFLVHSSKDEFNLELGSIIKNYLYTASPRSKSEQIKYLVENRARTCPSCLEHFLWTLWRGESSQLSKTVALTAKVLELAHPSAKEILAESYVHEVALVRDCLAATDLNQDTFHCRTQKLLQRYAAIRVERKRQLAEL